MTASQERKDGPNLKRALGLYATTAIVMGSVVGSGIFTSPASMARDVPHATVFLAVWLLAGLLTLLGALTQSELVGQMPRTGGMYEYLSNIYGERTGFLYGWANFMIAGSGAIAAISYVFASYLDEVLRVTSGYQLPRLSQAMEAMPVHLPMLGDIFPFADMGIKLAAAVIVMLLTALNIRGVKLGGGLQSISTTSKILAILVIVAIVFIAGTDHGSTGNWSSATPKGMELSGWTLFGAIALAMSGAFWAYDGWGTVASVAGEVREPQRTIPRAIIGGTLLVITIYMVVNLSYLYIFPVDQLAGVPNDRVASAIASVIFGARGALLVSLLIMLSTFDATNSSILTNARVYFAMGEKGLFHHRAHEVHHRYHTPYVALMLQGAWAIILLISGSFGLITDMYVFVNWMIYVLMAMGVFILRRRDPDRPRPFKVPGYPFVPAVFIFFALVYLIITLTSDISLYRLGEQPIVKSVTGLVLVLAGLPLYYFWKFRRRKGGW